MLVNHSGIADPVSFKCSSSGRHLSAAVLFHPLHRIATQRGRRGGQFGWAYTGVSSNVVVNPNYKTTAADEKWGYTAGEQLVVNAPLGTAPAYFSYGYNDWGTVNLLRPCLASGAHMAGPETYMRPTSVRVSSDMIAVCETTADGVDDCAIDPTLAAFKNEALAGIHNGNANVLFCDGHDVPMLPSDLVIWQKTTSGPPIYDPNSPVAKHNARQWNNDHVLHLE